MTYPAAPAFTPSERARGVLRWSVKTLLSTALYGIALFLAAGTLDWPAGLRFFAVFLLIQIVNGLVLIPARPELILERSKPQPGTKRWDMFLVLAMALFGPLLIFTTAGFSMRSGWPAWENWGLQAAGLVICAAGGMFSLWAMASNPFFASTVRIQAERGHKVISSGPYRIVRHPGYLGGLVFNLGVPLALGAPYAYLAVLAVALVFFARTDLEDRCLQDELPGYREYARNVPRRLIPFLW